MQHAVFASHRISRRNLTVLLWQSVCHVYCSFSGVNYCTSRSIRLNLWVEWAPRCLSRQSVCRTLLRSLELKLCRLSLCNLVSQNFIAIFVHSWSQNFTTFFYCKCPLVHFQVSCFALQRPFSWNCAQWFKNFVVSSFILLLYFLFRVQIYLGSRAVFLQIGSQHCALIVLLNSCGTSIRLE